MRLTPGLVAISMSAIALAGCLAGEPAAHLVIVDGVAWTHGRPVGFASDVAIRDGRIVYVGDDANDFIGPLTKVIDAAGGSILPGFRDSHMHVTWIETGTTVGRLVGGRPLIPEYAPAGEMGQLRGDTNTFATQVPFHAHRHALYTALGTEAPTLYDECVPADPSVIDDWMAAFQAAEEEMAAQGITTVVEAITADLGVYEALRQMEDHGLSKVRWLLRVVPGCYELMDEAGIRPDTPGDWVRLHGVKLYGDGFMGGHVAALREPYADRPGWTGVLVYPDAVLDDFIREAADRGLHVTTHAIGDATIEQVLAAYERVGITPDDRWSIEHVQVTDPALIAEFARLGVVPSIQLSFATTDQRMAEDRLGAERTAAAYDWSGFVDAGVVVAGGSDYPIEVITPLWGLQRETTRQEVDGTPDGGWFPENGLTLDEALGAITHGAAYVAHEEHERGALAAGMVADIVVLAEDLFSVEATEIAGGTIRLTVVNGVVTFEGWRAYPPTGQMADPGTPHAGGSQP